MQLTIFTANVTGMKSNVVYPNEVVVDNETDFMAAIEHDHVLAKYKNFRRGKDNFIESDCIVMDCDNDHSDDPSDWVSMEDFAASIPDIRVAIAPSKSHMKEKDGKPARPRYHLYFPTDGVISDADEYVSIKKAIQAEFPFLDAGALDAARFIFGTPQTEVIWQEGDNTIEHIVGEAELPEEDEPVIPEGRRNSMMSRFAARVLIRMGDCDRAYETFKNHADKCDPPLDDEELEVIWNSAKRFYKKVASSDSYVPPKDYEFGRGSLKPDDYSDIGQAKVIFREYGSELRYSSATDLLRYDGISWVESKQKAIGAVIEFLELQLKDAKQQLGAALAALKDKGVAAADIDGGGKKFMSSLTTEQIKLYEEYLAAKAYFAFVMKRRDMKYITSAIQALKPMIDIPVTDLDADPFLLNTPSYTYDLREGVDMPREHMASDLITKVTAVDPSDEGKDIWLDAIDKFFCSDTELIDYVQQMCGLGIIGQVFMEIMIMAFGGGSNGKSTYFNTIARVIGSYYGNMSADALTLGCKRNTQYEVAEAKGKRLLIAAELEEGTRLNTAFVKQMASTDMIFSQKKFRDPFSFTPSHILVLYTNHLPMVSSSDSGTWRRLIIIPFNATITGKSDIKNYTEYLVKNAGGYVLKWLMEGAKKIIDNEFHIDPPQVVKDAIAKYRSDNDWLHHFLEECCDIDPSYSCKSGELYSEYRSFALRSGEPVKSTTEFYNSLAALGFERHKTKVGAKVLKLRIKPEDFAD